MFSLRSVLGLALTALLPVAIGCAAPAPDDAVDDSEGALRGTNGGGSHLAEASATYDAISGYVTEAVTLSGTNKGVRVCEAFLDGTEAQKHACDTYPGLYAEMNCSGGGFHGVTPPQSTPGVQCTRTNQIGKVPFASGEGTYRIAFVNEANPTDRKTIIVNVASDFFQLKIDGADYPPYKGTPQENGFYDVNSGATTEIAGTLHITIEVKSSLSSQVLGCADGFSTAGLSAHDIAQRQAASMIRCAGPKAQLEGRDGWTKRENSPVAGHTELSYDVTPLVQPSQRLIFTFTSNGVGHGYVFDNP